MKLVIVESPTKAKTIGKFLGRTYTVKSSFGHVRDLPKKDMGIDIEHDFAPHYIIPTKAKKKVSELKKAAKEADEIILASDEDREGEAIAWHLAHILGVEKKANYKRIAFHEITKEAIQKALENPRALDLNLIDAQQARRVLDRLVGYELSPFLWKKIKRGLSAGRVQSVALRLIVEREREIEKFQTTPYFTFEATLTDPHQETLLATIETLDGEKFEETQTHKLFAGDYKTKFTIMQEKSAAETIAADLKNAKYKIENLESKEISRNPQAPFTTSTLQQAAINSLGFSAKQTMAVAQKLYERGHITYMRTDSVNLSLQSLIAAQKTIEKMFGKKYALKTPRHFTTKAKGAQEAHEAIRPTYPEQTPEELSSKLEPSEARLYELIWRRMMACQMAAAILNSEKINLSAKGQAHKYTLRASGNSIKFDGYLKAWAGRKNPEEKILPKLKVGEVLSAEEIVTLEKTSTPPPRYNEASLVKVLEEHQIGRPSTYAPTISTIIDRNYVERGEDKKLHPLEIGLLVNDVLVEHFAQIVEINFTAQIERDFDAIAEGQKKWPPVIRAFYEPFHKNIEEKTMSVKQENVLEKLDRQCPECGGDLIVRFGRFGKFIACAKYPECKYTEKTEADKKMDEENSGEVCEKCGKPMLVKRGRFGAFLGCSGYPDCKNIKSIANKIGVKCPKCGEGDVVLKKSKKGKSFYGCSRYPNCDFVSWGKPTGEKCPQCGSPMAIGAKGQTMCTNKECNHKQ